MVLLQIGKMQWQYFHNLNQGEIALKEAYEIASRDSWNKPLYQATALNEWARIRRFRGDFNDAFNKAIKAIRIYEEHNKRDINLGSFYETLGLVYKANEQYEQALQQFRKALKIYDDIQGPVEKFKSTVNLEMGHVYFLKNDFIEAERYYQDAYRITKALKNTRLYYYLSTLNKLAELNLGLYEDGDEKDPTYLSKAKNFLTEQKELSANSGYDLWYYWSVQYLAEIEFTENKLANKDSLITTLNSLLSQYDKKLHREFGPAFWQTKHLLYKISMHQGDQNSAILHLAEGLAYLANTWKIRFGRNLGILRNELLQLNSQQQAYESKRLIEFWRNSFRDDDPMPDFIEMCESFMTL
jgi:tetratricopeptide (TPR) repeat protein